MPIDQTSLGHAKVVSLMSGFSEGFIRETLPTSANLADDEHSE
jgi:hypothetical protein